MLKVFSRYVPIRSLFFLGSETCVIVFVVWAALAWLWPIHDGMSDDWSGRVFLNAVWVVPLCQLSLYYHDLYLGSRSTPTWRSFVKILQSIGLAALVVLGHCMLFPESRLGYGMILALAILPFTLIGWRAAYAKLIASQAFDQRMLLVGTGRLAEDVVTALNADPNLGHTIAARLPEFPNAGPRTANLGDRRAEPASLIEFIRQYRIARVVVAVEDRRGKFPIDELLRCKFSGVKIDDGPSFYERMTGKVHVDALKPSWLIFSEGFRRHRFTAVMKRGLDVGSALIGLLVIAPLIPLIAAAIKWDSPGPVLYRQERVGAGEKRFVLIKFRSMRANAEKTTGPVWAQNGDERVTRVGAWLRTFRLDEVPQLVNVLRGEMSIVGPRPERPCFVETLQAQIPYYGLRHTVKPGLTGWAQVRYQYGASVQDTIEKLQYDLYYIKNMSLLLDATILIETVKIILLRRGAR